MKDKEIVSNISLTPFSNTKDVTIRKATADTKNTAGNVQLDHLNTSTTDSV
jgi:hypothetical protein